MQTIIGLELTPLFAARLCALGFELRGQHLELYGRCLACQGAPDVHPSHLQEEQAL